MKQPVAALLDQEWVFTAGQLTGLPSAGRRISKETAFFGATGAGVTVYLVDSGIRPTHREFAPARAGMGGDFVGDGRAGEDCHGHGTHVAGIVGGNVYGVAPGVRLIALRVADCRGAMRDAALLAALDRVADSHRVRKPVVVNYSLSADVAWTTPEVVRRIEDAVQRLVTSGVTVVATGNDSSDACRRTPGRVAAVLTVSSADAPDAGAAVRSRPASHGRCVDLFAPGERTRSAWWTDDAVTRTGDGTSVAAAYVTGAVARYLECNPAASPAKVARALLVRATHEPLVDAGSGSPDRLLSRAQLTSKAFRAPCPPPREAGAR